MSDTDLIPNMSEGDRHKLNVTLEDISRNSAIRTEIICKRRNGKTIEQACRELSEDFNLSELHIRDIYYDTKHRKNTQKTGNG